MSQATGRSLDELIGLVYRELAKLRDESEMLESQKSVSADKLDWRIDCLTEALPWLHEQRGLAHSRDRQDIPQETLRQEVANKVRVSDYTLSNDAVEAVAKATGMRLMWTDIGRRCVEHALARCGNREYAIIYSTEATFSNGMPERIRVLPFITLQIEIPGWSCSPSGTDRYGCKAVKYWDYR